MQYSLALLSLATSALATTQVPFYWPGLDNSTDSSVDPVASIVNANPSTTVMQLACPSNADSDSCGWGSGELTVSVISTSTYIATFTDESTSVSFGCTSKQAMTCVMAIPGLDLGVTLSGVDAASLATQTTTIDRPVMQTATVTAGENKLQGSGNASAGSSATGAASGSGAKSSGAKATGSVTATGASAQHTGAAGRFAVEGAALFGLAGAAAFNLL